MADQDPLSLLRISIKSHDPPILSTSPSPPLPGTPPIPLHLATHLIFQHPTPVSFPLSTPTRFHKKEGDSPGPVDLRSIYFAWLNRDLAIPDYVALAQGFQNEAGAGGIVNLVFVERLDLVGWLEGVQEESDFIAPVGEKKAVPAQGGGGVAGQPGAGGIVVGRGREGGLGAQGGAAVGTVGVVGQNAQAGGVGGPRPARQIDPRLLEIYSHERVVVNRNTALRGAKPMDFTYVRKHTEDFVSRLKTTSAAGTLGKPLHPTSSATNSPSAPLHKPISPGSHSTSSSRSYPIILLSPSASALLNMTNVKAFLENGVFNPPLSSLPNPHSAAAPPPTSLSTAPQMLDISRLLPSINSTTPQRFIVVDSPEKFKPEYWARVVAVFTTGQAWQFRSYKWHNPQELFRHVKGFYVGWDGEQVPETVRGWGSGVTCVAVERSRRFRDREVCEVVWMEIERWMSGTGWGAGGGRG